MLRRRALEHESPGGGTGRFLIVGLGNPGSRYAATRHNIGFEVGAELSRRWELSRAREKFRGMISEGRTGPGGSRVAILLPQTFMNESGSSVGPARGSLGVGLDRTIVIHDEIDLPFGTVKTRLGGGLAGHNGLKSLAAGIGGKDFWRVRIGVGRPDSSDPEVVSRHVLSRFTEPDEDVRDLIAAGADAVEELIAQVEGSGPSPEANG